MLPLVSRDRGGPSSCEMLGHRLDRGSRDRNSFVLSNESIDNCQRTDISERWCQRANSVGVNEIEGWIWRSEDTDWQILTVLVIFSRPMNNFFS